MTDTRAPRVGAYRPTLHRPSTIRELLNSVFFIAAALILSELAFPRSAISGPSMEPTLFEGQHLLISRVHYLLGSPQRGDIAVFDNPNDNDGHMLIKRVIGIPGDTIEFRQIQVTVDGQMRNDGELYVNGVLTEEPYFINRPCNSCNGTWVLGPDEYFMVGDNRNRSEDSRVPRVGLIPREYIVGKAIWRHWPLDLFGPVP